jgi:hypothetical protein
MHLRRAVAAAASSGAEQVGGGEPHALHTSFERSGMEKGERKGFQAAIAAALAARFGTAAKRLMARFRKINDVDELHALVKAIVSAENLQEIRDRLPPREG